MLKTLFAAAAATALLVCGSALAEDRIVPPDLSIDPLAMTDAELKKHPEIPPKPDAKQAPKDYELWVKSMKFHRNGIREGKFKTLDAPPQYGATYSNDPNFSGAQATPPSGLTTGAASLSFYIPNYSCRAPGATQISHWAGMTHVGSQLWQAGIYAAPSFAANCSLSSLTLAAFWEDYIQGGGGSNSGIKIFPLTVSVGDSIYAQVWSTGAYSAYAKVTNFTTGQYVTVSHTTSWSLANTAFQWLTESSSPYPPHFYVSNWQFYGAASDQNGHIYAPGAYTYSDVNYKNMYRYPNTLMSINSIGYESFKINN